MSLQKLDASGNPATRKRYQMIPEGHSLCKQSFQKECDINNIMKKFEKNGLVNHLNTHSGGYGNYIGYEDYHQSLNKILAADAAFQALPAQARKKFNNDPATFLEYAQNPDNLPGMREMGLAPPEPLKPSTGEPPADGGTPSPKDGGPTADPPGSSAPVSTGNKPAPPGAAAL